MDCVGLWKFVNDFDCVGVVMFEWGVFVVWMMCLFGC